MWYKNIVYKALIKVYSVRAYQWQQTGPAYGHFGYESFLNVLFWWPLVNSYSLLLLLPMISTLAEDSPNNHPDGPPMTCGRIGSEKLLRKKSSNSICCGDEQYSPDTHCCCLDGAFRTEARGCSLCCEQDKNQAPLGDLSLFESNVSKDDSHNIVRQPCHPSTACCGQQPFDPSSAVCYGLKILAHPLRCCGGGKMCGTLCLNLNEMWMFRCSGPACALGFVFWSPHCINTYKLFTRSLLKGKTI